MLSVCVILLETVWSGFAKCGAGMSRWWCLALSKAWHYLLLSLLLLCVLQSLLEGLDEVNSDLWAVLSLEQGLASLAVNCVCVCVTVVAGRSG